jgi:uncharacterized protein (TIGR00369 family)
MTTHHPGPRRSPEEQAKLESEIRRLFEERVAFNRVLGFSILSLDAAHPRARFAMKPELVGHYATGQLHGGVTAAVLDAMSGFALTLAIAEKFNDESATQTAARFGRLGTIDLRIDYLHRGVGKWFEAGARVTRLGGRLGSVQTTLHADDGTLVATGTAAFVIS